MEIRRKILVIDDDPVLTELLKSRLAENGFNAEVASDGQEGLEKFRGAKPDAIILDIKMPRMDGYSFLLEFKKTGDLRRTPVIVLTAHENMREIFRLEGVNDYLLKPVNIELLIQKIHKHLANVNKKILVVDDEVNIVELLEMRLRANSYDVITAFDGVEGLEKARREFPDLILLDVMMPKMDGFNVCRLLKFDEQFKAIPIILLTARKQEIDQETSRQVGADAYIAKPFENDVLLDKMKELLWD